MESNERYYRRRAVEERMAAQRAMTEQARAWHAKLAADFAQYKYDPKRLLEWICLSDPYQLSHVAQKEYADPKYDPYFSPMPLKALTPEVLFESLMTATRAEDAASRAGNRG